MGIPLESTQPACNEHSSKAVLPSTKQKKAEKPNRGSSNSRTHQRSGGRLGTDSIGFYLSSIGRVPLLTPAEEIELAHHVQTIHAVTQLPCMHLFATHLLDIPAPQCGIAAHLHILYL